MNYCSFVQTLDENHLHRQYHDTEYGFPIEEDNALFGRLILEINQAGLSWLTILKKKEHFEQVYSEFDIQKVAAYTDKDQERLLQDSGIIRNKLKINAAIHNAKQILKLQEEFGSFKNWLDFHFPKEKTDWVKLFKKYFKFTGGEITGEFLMSTGYLEGAHTPDCPIYEKVRLSKPAWLSLKS